MILQMKNSVLTLIATTAVLYCTQIDNYMQGSVVFIDPVSFSSEPVIKNIVLCKLSQRKFTEVEITGNSQYL